MPLHSVATLREEKTTKKTPYTYLMSYRLCFKLIVGPNVILYALLLYTPPKYQQPNYPLSPRLYWLITPTLPRLDKALTRRSHYHKQSHHTDCGQCAAVSWVLWLTHSFTKLPTQCFGAIEMQRPPAEAMPFSKISNANA